MSTRVPISMLLFLATAGVSNAETRTFIMEGTVSFKTDTIGGILDFVHIDDRVVYTYTFDLNAPDTEPDPNEGYYYGMSASTRVASTPLATNVPRITVQLAPNLFDAGSYIQASGYNGWLHFSLADYHNLTIASTNLPHDPYPLMPFVID